MAANSTALLTDLNATVGNFQTACYTAAEAATGPIMDLDGMVRLAVHHLEETKTILARIMAGSDEGLGTGPVTNSNDSTNYDKLLGVYQIIT